MTLKEQIIKYIKLKNETDKIEKEICENLQKLKGDESVVFESETGETYSLTRQYDDTLKMIRVYTVDTATEKLMIEKLKDAK